MFGHVCRKPEKKLKVGETYRCICGIEYKCVRVFPWRKFVKVGNGN